MVAELRDYGVTVDVHDPWADAAEAMAEYGITLTGEPQGGAYDAVVLAVAHDQFRALGGAWVDGLLRPDHVIYDLKHVLAAGAADLRL